LVGERYIAAASPYWAFKAFLPLAAPADHPFWTAEEEPLSVTAPVVQLQPGLALSRDPEQVLAVNGPPRAPRHISDGPAKYSRFAYSSLFGPCLEVDAGKAGIVSDSTLVLTDLNGERRVRDDAHDFEVDGEALASTWQPWADVEVRTVLW